MNSVPASETPTTPNRAASGLDPARQGEFVQLLTGHQRRLYLFILSVLPHPADAEEVLQETNLVIWNKSPQYVPGTDFFAWGARIATYEVLKFRERRGRERLRFEPDLVEVLAREAAGDQELAERRRAALLTCLGRLRPKDRQLIQDRYRPGADGKSVAAQMGRPINAVYQSLGRIRRTLWECVNRVLAAEAHP